mgnify:CR=1 FL=1
MTTAGHPGVVIALNSLLLLSVCLLPCWSVEPPADQRKRLEAELVALHKQLDDLGQRLEGDGLLVPPPDLSGPQRAIIQREIDAVAAQQKSVRAELTALKESAAAPPPALLAAQPRLDGSTSGHPLVMAILAHRLGLSLYWHGRNHRGFFGSERMPRVVKHVDPGLAAAGEALNEMQPAGTGPAYLLLAAGQRDLLIEARLPASDELAAAAGRGTAFHCTPIALDAFVMIVHRDNPVTSLTRAQVTGIYTGAISNWREVGGADRPINAYRRNPLSGSEELFRSLALPDVPLERLVAGKPMEVPTMTGLMNVVGSDVDGIGYSVWYYQQKIDHRADVRLLAIDGVYPWHGSISDRSYPWTSEVYAVIRPDAGPAVLALRDWLTGSEGQALVRSIGYAPVGSGR